LDFFLILFLCTVSLIYWHASALLCRQVSIPKKPRKVIQLLDLIKNIVIYVPKKNESLTGLEQHEGK